MQRKNEKQEQKRYNGLHNIVVCKEVSYIATRIIIRFRSQL